MRWLFLLLVVAEFFLFARMTSTHYAWIYPRWNDQIQPLTEAYTAYEYRKENGLLPGIGHALTSPAAQGNQHSLWALLAFEAAGGPSRGAALAVNMLVFIAWQAALAFAVARGTGSRSLPWLAVGLTLALHWPWSGIQGSAMDFRLDQAALCLMGIALAAALLTDGFRARSWSAVFGVAVGLTILTRFLTVTYFAVIFCACFGWVMVARDRWQRARNLGLAGVITACLVLPFFWLNWRAIYEHYWIGHYQHSDGLLWSTQLPYGRAFIRIWQQLVVWQLGAAFGAAAGLAVLVLAGGAVWARNRRPPAPPDTRGRWPRETAILGAIFLLAPVLVLALQNNDRMVVVVLGVAVPGALTLVLALAAGLRARAIGAETTGALKRVPGGAALIALVIGGGHFVIRQTTPPYDEAFLADARRIEAIADRVFTAVQISGLTGPRVAVDQVTDCLDGTILRVLCYERHRVWVPFIMQLPTGISVAPEPLLMEHLARSDFVFATEDGPPGPWPYDGQMFNLRPQILAWCDGHLRLVERFNLFGRRIALYQRPDIGVAPVMVFPPRLLCSTGWDFAHRVEVTMGSAQFQAAGLPPGLGIDAGSGLISGRPAGSGAYAASVTATNAAGSTTRDIVFQVEAADFFALAEAPAVCTAGEPVEVKFDAFDAEEQLDFLEITDLTTQQALDRLATGATERRNWSGRYRTVFSVPGKHLIALRFVRLAPKGKGGYDFIDRHVEITVAPAPAVAN